MRRPLLRVVPGELEQGDAGSAKTTARQKGGVWLLARIRHRQANEAVPAAAEPPTVTAQRQSVSNHQSGPQTTRNGQLRGVVSYSDHAYVSVIVM